MRIRNLLVVVSGAMAGALISAILSGDAAGESVPDTIARQLVGGGLGVKDTFECYTGGGFVCSAETCGSITADATKGKKKTKGDGTNCGGGLLGSCGACYSDSDIVACSGS